MNKATDKNRINKLIEFFKTFKQIKPGPDQADYSAWDQTEDEYQRQQARWLKKVKNKGNKKSDK